MTTWAEFHTASEALAIEAETISRHGKPLQAAQLYTRAAHLEEQALAVVDPTKLRTKGITAVRTIEEAHQDLAAWVKKWGKRYQKLCDWVEANIEETLTFYRLPRQHHKNMKSTNLLERLNEEFKRRTLVVRIFPNVASCLRLIRALAVEMHENWIEARRYLNMEDLKEHKKEQLRRAAA